MEKFYKVTNTRFLKEIKDYQTHRNEQNKFIENFFKEHDISGKEFHICGNGSINVPFGERSKNEIRLYILDCEENNRKFGKELLKPVMLFCDSDIKMRAFRTNSKTLKIFQDLCVERKIIINACSVRVGDYFKELNYGAYVISKFEYNGVYYLKISKDKDEYLTPKYDGFDEIKGSEYYIALEQLEAEK